MTQGRRHTLVLLCARQCACCAPQSREAHGHKLLIHTRSNHTMITQSTPCAFLLRRDASLCNSPNPKWSVVHRIKAIISHCETNLSSVLAYVSVSRFQRSQKHGTEEVARGVMSVGCNIGHNKSKLAPSCETCEIVNSFSTYCAKRQGSIACGWLASVLEVRDLLEWDPFLFFTPLALASNPQRSSRTETFFPTDSGEQLLTAARNRSRSSV
mmetsp:Transcript_11287/g.27988  ORF Transcript_11287/g.27988 Transcript_11287/m.27988 type:complete len:212 (-) Transcript_11287:506-1141(-)